MSAGGLPPLLVITDRRQSRLPLSRQVEALIAGGCRWVMLREKDLSEGERRRLALPMAAALAKVGGRLTVNGDPALAEELGCDLHLGQGEAPGAWRARMAPGALIGLSCHGRDELAAAEALGADYALLSPVFESASKPGYGPPLGVAGLRALLPRAKLPVLALGGVTVENADACRRAGAAGVAVMGEAMRSMSPSLLVAELLAALDAGQ